MTHRTLKIASLLAVVIFLALGPKAQTQRPPDSKSPIADPAKSAADSDYVDEFEAYAEDAALRSQDQFIMRIAITVVILIGAMLVFIPGLRQAITKGAISVDRRADGANSSNIQTYPRSSPTYWWVCIQYVLFLVVGFAAVFWVWLYAGG